MIDSIEKLGNSLIHHGKANNRIYVMKLAKEDYPAILGELDALAKKNGYTKIFVKIPASLQTSFLNNGYKQEAFIMKFFKGIEDAYFMGKYFDAERENFKDETDILSIITTCYDKVSKHEPVDIKNGFTVKLLDESHIPQIVDVYKRVFETYPFPIFDPEYILETMKDHIDYFGIFKGEQLVALSSSEMDLENLNSEMTDFATLPEYRGNNLSYYLLEEMEKVARAKGINTLYTIARAKVAGMNITFAKMFYEFGGSLVNNTYIAGGIETMNVWFKNLL